MKNVLEYLEASASAFPDKTAAIDAFGACTYKTLLNRCQRVGSVLAGKIDRGAPVAVFMEKGIAALCAFWGITYAGGFYVLLNTEFPKPACAKFRKYFRLPASLQIRCTMKPYEVFSRTDDFKYRSFRTWRCRYKKTKRNSETHD